MADVEQDHNSAGLTGTSLVTAVVTDLHIAVLDPAVPLLEPLLTYPRRTFVPGGPLGYQEVKETVSLCDFDIKGRLAFSAGLLPRVRRTLQEHGYTVGIDDQRKSGPRLAVDEHALDGADADILPLMQAIVREPLGQIEAANREDRINKILLIGEIFPDARVVVAVATKREAWAYWSQLKKRLGGMVGLARSEIQNTKKRWLVGTFGSIPFDWAGDFDIVLLPSAEEATGNCAIDLIVTMQFRRIYSFIQPGRRPDRLIQLRLEQMSGPVIHRVKKPRLPVRVLMLPTPACTVANATTALERKRTHYWHNDVRNEHIAAVAKAVFSGDRQMLKGVGLRNKDIRLLKGVDKIKVVLLVESPEHGRKLLALLPSWMMLDLVPRNAMNIAGNNTIMTKTPAIVTGAYAARNTIRADIVIQAMGTEWPLRIRGFPRKAGKRTPAELLVIDFNDQFVGAARNDTESRMQVYERQGMRVAILQTEDS